VIRVTYTKPVREDTKILAQLAQPMALATATARHIHRRIAAGDTATPAEAYSTKPTSGPAKARRYYISPAYAERVGLGKQTRWKSSAEMHAAKGLQPGKASATGEMLRNITVRNWGGEGAVIEFTGSSLGASSTRTARTRKVGGTYEVTLSDNGKVRARQVRELTRDEGGAVQYRRKPKLVRNREKAAAVFRHSRVGLLQTTDDETLALWCAWANKAGSLVRRAMGIPEGVPIVGGNRQLFDAATQELG
jgi:hypothetical protein